MVPIVGTMPNGHLDMGPDEETWRHNTGKYSSINKGILKTVAGCQGVTHRTTHGEHHSLPEAPLFYGLEDLYHLSPAMVSTEPPQAPSQ